MGKDLTKFLDVQIVPVILGGRTEREQLLARKTTAPSLIVKTFDFPFAAALECESVHPIGYAGRLFARRLFDGSTLLAVRAVSAVLVCLCCEFGFCGRKRSDGQKANRPDLAGDVLPAASGGASRKRNDRTMTATSLPS
jgi:hypothetical protein